MPRLFKLGETTAALRRFPVYLVDATDGLTPETGEATGQPQISQIGEAWANTTATLTAVGNGHYYVELTAAELDTLGYFAIRYKSANTAEFNMDGQVVAFDPYDAVRAGLTALPNAAADAAGGLAISDAGGLNLDAMNTNVSSILTDTNELQTDWANGGRLDLLLDAVATAQEAAQILNRTAGVVYYVATAANGGDDANDGLSPATPKLSPKTIIEAASAGDTVIIGPGTFALGAAKITVPANVTVTGAGLDRTVITSTGTLAGVGPIITPGNNATIQDLTVLGAGSTQGGVGSASAAGDGAFTNAILRRVKTDCDYDGIYLNHATQCTLVAIDCILGSGADGIAILAGATSLVTSINCWINAAGAGNTDAILCNAGTVRAVNCHMRSVSSGAGAQACGLKVGGGTIEAQGGSVYSYCPNINRSLSAVSGSIVVSGLEYDRSLEFISAGTITHASAAQSAVVLNKLDHLLAVAESDEAVDNSIVAKLASSTGDWSTFVASTDALEALRDHTVSAANVLTQVNAALDTAIAELGVGAPTATPTLRTGLMLLYHALRNKLVVQTSGTDAIEIYNDAGTKIASKAITDDGSDYQEAQMQ